MVVVKKNISLSILYTLKSSLMTSMSELITFIRIIIITFHHLV